MGQAGWKRLDSADLAPRCFGTGDEGWFRFSMVSPNFGTPVGKRRLMRLRSEDPAVRDDAAAEFARHLIEFLPRGAVVAFMPSSTRRTARSDPNSVSAAVLSALAHDQGAPVVVEPLVRAAPVPSVADTRVRNVDLLVSTLEPMRDVRIPDTLYVIDAMVASGATFAGFARVLRAAWPHVRPVLLAWVR